MGLLSILENKAKNNKRPQEQRVIKWLYYQAGEIMALTAEHLKYVDHVLEEFDCHDVTHSEKVLEIIENLLGDEAKHLSSYNLFFLIAVSYLHDCGMAVSDFESKVLKMAERNLDHEKPLSKKEAEAKIKRNRKSIYGSFDNGEIKNWLFVPEDEDSLISYFAKLLRDYQKYRHGRIDEIDANSGNNRAKSALNKKIRIDYLRISHHERIEDYVKNWGKTKFKDFPIQGMSQPLADGVAKCCRVHGEEAAYLHGDQFKDVTKVKYYGSETTNLQFVAMMLRLGDIIHFSYDRAHPVLRALHHFESKYSYDQWHIKANGLSFDVSNGVVSCIAHCQSPKDYYDLWTYVDYIDKELDLFNVISPKWLDFPTIVINDKVDRTNINHDTSFEPAHERKFTLDQKRVLELLMGSKLYTNEYACLRELYQNSLDACRCQMAARKNSRNRKSGSIGRIEFGLGEQDSKKYVYCLDNGKGMTRTIIEKFMLHVGSSYYRSPEFYQRQVETGSDFTPTSQFGIGILSCFMIGDIIEITTREEGKEVVSCVMEGTNGYFYYKKNPSEQDERLIDDHGTLVKVFLNNHYQRLLNDDPIKDYAYLLWYYGYDVPPTVYDRWSHHLYNIINGFVLIVPENINVLISLHSNTDPIKIYNKPLPITKELQNYTQLDYWTDDDYYQFEQLKEGDYLLIQAPDKNDIQNKDKNLECRTILEVERETYGRNIRMNGEGRCCVDGIVINGFSEDSNSLLYRLMSMGVLNFNGKKRPQLSVSRDDIITSLLNYEGEARGLLEDLIKKSITKVCLYIKEKNIQSNDSHYNEIWFRLLKKFDFCMALFYKCLQDVETSHEMIMPFQSIIMKIGYFIKDDTTKLPRKEMSAERKYTVMQLLFLRLLESNKIECSAENELEMTGHTGFPKFIPEVKTLNIYEYYFCPLQYDTYWKEYDIVQFAKFRLISDELKNQMNELIYNTIGKRPNYTNYVYLDKKMIKKSINAMNRRNRRFNTIKKSRESKKIKFIVVDDFNLNKIHNFIYRLIGDPIMWLMSKNALSFKRNSIDIHYSGLTLYVQNKSLLLLMEIDRDQKYRKICFSWRGKRTRQEMINSIPIEWKDIIENILFLDGTILSP